jgi:hypothetical protein
MLLPGELFLVLHGFAAGGNAFPVLPSPPVVLYLATLLVVLPPLLAQAVRAVRRRGATEARPFATALAAAIAVHVLCLVPGALGRADAGHVFFYGMGAFLLALLGDGPGARWKWAYTGAVLAVFQILLLAVSLHFLLPPYRSAAGQALLRWVNAHPRSWAEKGGRSLFGDGQWSRLMQRLRDVRYRSLEESASELAGLGRVCVPFGDPEVFASLAARGTMQTEYYYAMSNVFTREHVRRKIADLENCAYLILHADSEEAARPASPARDADASSFLQWNLLFPWLPARRTPGPEDPIAPIGMTIRENFIFAKPLNSNWSLWMRR